MSSNSYIDICPKCGNEIDITQESKPYDHINGDCLCCGFTYFTVEDQITLGEINRMREDSDMPKLKKLAIQNKEE